MTEWSESPSAAASTWRMVLLPRPFCLLPDTVLRCTTRSATASLRTKRSTQKMVPLVPTRGCKLLCCRGVFVAGYVGKSHHRRQARHLPHQRRGYQQLLLGSVPEAADDHHHDHEGGYPVRSLHRRSVGPQGGLIAVVRTAR